MFISKFGPVVCELQMNFRSPCWRARCLLSCYEPMHAAPAHFTQPRHRSLSLAGSTSRLSFLISALCCQTGAHQQLAGFCASTCILRSCISLLLTQFPSSAGPSSNGAHDAHATQRLSQEDAASEAASVSAAHALARAETLDPGPEPPPGPGD